MTDREALEKEFLRAAAEDRVKVAAMIAADPSLSLEAGPRFADIREHDLALLEDESDERREPVPRGGQPTVTLVGGASLEAGSRR